MDYGKKAADCHPLGQKIVGMPAFASAQYIKFPYL
jgi:hypothetical protein